MTHGARTGVAALAGRRIDAPDADEPRFPTSAEPAVRSDLRHVLLEHRIGTLVASAACGADILALEVAAELGLQRVIVLPFEPSLFRATSVADRGESWGKRFDALLAQAGASTEILQLASSASAGDGAYAAATQRILAEAQARSPKDESPLAIAIWEGATRAGTDATKDFVDQAEAAGMEVRSIISTGR